MSEFDNLDSYNGDPVYDGWVDFDYNENTGELQELFEDTDLDQSVDDLNDWDQGVPAAPSGYRYALSIMLGIVQTSLTMLSLNRSSR